MQMEKVPGSPSVRNRMRTLVEQSEEYNDHTTAPVVMSEKQKKKVVFKDSHSIKGDEVAQWSPDSNQKSADLKLALGS